MNRRKYNNRNVYIEFVRLIFMICVICGHIYCIFYQTAFSGKYGYELTQMHNVATDGFFILTGFFLAASISNKKKAERQSWDLFLEYNLGRIKSFYGPLLFSTLFAVFIEVFITKSIAANRIYLYWPNLFLVGINGIPSGGSSWYLYAILYAGMIISMFYIFCRELSVYILFPIIIVLGNAWMYNTFSCENLGSSPLVMGWLSSGIIRAIVIMCIGVELFAISEYFVKIGCKFSNLFITFGEIVGTAILCLALFIPRLGPTCFLVYPSLGILLFLFYTDNVCVYRVLNKIPISAITKYSLMVYLSHTSVLRILQHCNAFITVPAILRCILLLLVSLASGIVLYWIEKKLRTSMIALAKKYCLSRQ